MKKLLISLTLLILCAGCASTSSIKLSHKTYPAKPKDCPIRVFSQAPAHLKYEEIALLSGRGGQTLFSSHHPGSVIPELKVEACELGADAIIIKDAKEGGINGFNDATRAELSATAIKTI